MSWLQSAGMCVCVQARHAKARAVLTIGLQVRVRGCKLDVAVPRLTISRRLALLKRARVLCLRFVFAAQPCSRHHILAHQEGVLAPPQQTEQCPMRSR